MPSHTTAKRILERHRQLKPENPVGSYLLVKATTALRQANRVHFRTLLKRNGQFFLECSAYLLIPQRLVFASLAQCMPIFILRFLRNSHDTASVSSIRGPSHASLRTILGRAAHPGSHRFPTVERGRAEEVGVRLPPVPGWINPEVYGKCVCDYEDAGTR
jgi:hypothetical protein